MRQRFDPTTLYSPQRARSVWLGRDLMRKIQDRLLTTERPDPAIKDPIELRPVLSLTCDIDQMVLEPNYVNVNVAYSAAAGWKALWSCPDDEIADICSVRVASGDAARTIDNLGICEDDAADPGNDTTELILTQGASQFASWFRLIYAGGAAGGVLRMYPGETLFANFAVNVAGGTANVQIKYIRLKTTEVPL